MTGNRELSALDALNLFGVFLQAMNYQSDLSQASNADIMAQLRQQDSRYLAEILNNQKKIIRMLEQSISAEK